ncbi:hypothetical protein D3C75_1140470 [compost metagenome]
MNCCFFTARSTWASIACSLDSTSFHWPRLNSFLSMIAFSDRLAGAPEPIPYSFLSNWSACFCRSAKSFTPAFHT